MKGIGEVDCYFVVNPDSPYQEWALRDIITPAASVLAGEYGIMLRSLAYEYVPVLRPGAITYVIYGPTNPLEMTDGERAYLASLAAAGVKTNVISAYPLTPTGADRPEYARARTAVPEMCDALDINAIFPDDVRTDVGIRTNNWRDVVINAVGETVRIKYQPTESIDPDDVAVLGRLGEKHARDIERLAELFREYHLWQRKPHTDGSIMFTHDGYWYASQTVTDKTLMTAEDFDLISAYDDGTRGITYTGSRLPSSDAPELLRLSSLMSMFGRRPRLIVHFHHRELTRGTRYRELVTDLTIEGGHFAAGREYFRQMRQMHSNWLIIRQHGPVWTGDSVAEFSDYVRRIVLGGG